MEKEEKSIYKGCGLREQIRKDLELHLEKFQDPVVLGELVFRLLEERENTNRLFKTLIQRLERLEQRLSALEGQADRIPSSERSSHGSPLLPEVEERILMFVKERGKVTAEEVRKAFGYKGRNAASARLNHLYRLGLLKKAQVGRKVVFMLNSPTSCP